MDRAVKRSPINGTENVLSQVHLASSTSTVALAPCDRIGLHCHLPKARAEGRTRLGGDIFIHGKAVSIGCLAIGDEAIEELFVLVGRVGKENVSVMIAPRDFRKQRPGREEERPAWVDTLYSDLEKELRKYQL